ncbi:MAG TPA: hypothetical protein VLF18_21345 [Tahibacter sp.]|uniref:hypothetical protein n=1 Tax=Tahibacter sp. TaxID=2056211 RepID=UPI002BFA384F|nr:hypothetical protein [Tahibacter sp.]HSX62736.1 hypothetical protein [Tahibacter sp.]
MNMPKLCLTPMLTVTMSAPQAIARIAARVQVVTGAVVAEPVVEEAAVGCMEDDESGAVREVSRRRIVVTVATRPILYQCRIENRPLRTMPPRADLR